MKTLKPAGVHSDSSTLLVVGTVLFLGVIAICLKWFFDIDPASPGGQTLTVLALFGTIAVVSAVFQSWRDGWRLAIVGVVLIGATILIGWLYTVGGGAAVVGVVLLTLFGSVLNGLMNSDLEIRWCVARWAAFWVGTALLGLLSGGPPAASRPSPEVVKRVKAEFEPRAPRPPQGHPFDDPKSHHSGKISLSPPRDNR